MFKFTPSSILIVANVGVYLYTSIIGGSFFTINPKLLLTLGQANALVMKGWYWQLLTSMFVHVNLIHLFMNMFFLFAFGLRAEELFSYEEYFLIYFASGFSGNLLTLLMGPRMVSAGASGAIFGMFGACVIYLSEAVGRSIMVALVYSFFLFVLSLSANVNVLAHLGGLATGLVIGYALARTRRSPAGIYTP